MTMDDLVDFLNARLDEDAARAQKKLQRYVDGEWVRIICDPVIGPFGGQSQLRDIDTGMYVADMSDPKRVLREVAAKRRILGWADSPALPDYEKRYVLDALAAVYSNHPDCRSEWKP